MSKRKIYIDGLGLVEGHFSGVGQYILGILRGIDELLDDAKQQGKETPRVRLIIPYNTVYKFRKFNFKHIEYKAFPMPFRYMVGFWYRGWMPPIDLWCGPGTYIFPRFVDMPLLFSKSSALTIFDLSYELHREYSDEGNAHFLSKRVCSSMENADQIITISENAKKEIEAFYKVHSNRVHVATPAVDTRYFYKRSSKEIDEVKKKYGINTKKYILALSNLEPRKNLDGLIDAYCMLSAKERSDTALVLVGVNGWKTEDLFRKIVSKVKNGYVIIRPNKYVSDADKPAILSGASMLVYPSHYEGFGMPPLEALACGTPVITANNSSLPEVVKKAGIMVDSKDTAALSDAIRQYLQNIDSVTKKAQLEGPQRALAFSWKESAKIYLSAAGVKEL